MIKGFKMKLYDGMAAEYEKRHNTKLRTRSFGLRAPIRN